MPSALAPVHQHLNWKKLQQAFVSSHRSVSALSHAQFCAVLGPAVSVALWTLQHAPHLLRRPRLSLLLANAGEFEALDCGRWLQFIPWLVGRPQLQVEATLIGRRFVRDKEMPRTVEALERQLRSHGSALVRERLPAVLVYGELSRWPEVFETAPDLCILPTPALMLNAPEFLAEGALPALAKAGTALGFFSTSETDLLVDQRTFAGYGWPVDPEAAWPNPFVLFGRDAQNLGGYLHMGWSVDPASVPEQLEADAAILSDLKYVLCEGIEELERRGVDAILTLGEPLTAADGAKLLRLPNDLALDPASLQLFQLQEGRALDAWPGFRVAPEAVASLPGHDNLLARASWALHVYAAHIKPHLLSLDEAIAQALPPVLPPGVSLVVPRTAVAAAEASS